MPVVNLTCGIENPTNAPASANRKPADGIDYTVFYSPALDQVMAG